MDNLFEHIINLNLNENQIFQEGDTATTIEDIEHGFTHGGRVPKVVIPKGSLVEIVTGNEDGDDEVTVEFDGQQFEVEAYQLKKDARESKKKVKESELQKSGEVFHVNGQCEHCGKDYENQNADAEGNVICPHCGEKSQNWGDPDDMRGPVQIDMEEKKVNEEEDPKYQEALDKFEEVKEFAAPILKGHDGFLSNEEFEDKVAEHFGGENMQTGGHCYVVYIVVNEDYYIGVTQESIVLYKRSQNEPIKTPFDADQDSFEGGGGNEIKVASFLDESKVNEGKYKIQMKTVFGWEDVANWTETDEFQTEEEAQASIEEFIKETEEEFEAGNLQDAYSREDYRVVPVSQASESKVNEDSTGTFYIAELPEFTGYGVFGYGHTPEEALAACEEGYLKLKKSYKIDSGNPDYGTFPRAFDYFGGGVKKVQTGSYGIVGNEDYIDITPGEGIEDEG